MRKILFLLLAGLLFCSPVYGQGCDSNTTNLMHFEGSDASTTITEEDCDGDGANSWTASGGAQIDTDLTAKFGTGSIKMTTLNDFLITSDSDDFAVGANLADAWTIDFWFYSTANIALWRALWNHQSSDTDPYVLITIRKSDTSDPNKVQWLGRRGDGDYCWFALTASAVTNSTWQHWAFVKTASNTIGIYIDGNQDAYDTVDDDTCDGGDDLEIGKFGSGLGGHNDLNGYLDEHRVQHSNYFSATPVVGLTDTITVPTEAYSVAATGGGQFIQIFTSFLKLEDKPGYRRVVAKHWYTHKGVEIERRLKNNI